MNLEALDNLERVVRAAPSDRRFAMEAYSLDYEDSDDEHDCGTAHCAAGWAAIDPWFVAKIGVVDLATSRLDVTLTELIGLTPIQSDVLFGVSDFRGEFFTDATGPTVKAEVLANIARLRRGEALVAYTGSIHRLFRGTTPVPGTGPIPA